MLPCRLCSQERSFKIWLIHAFFQACQAKKCHTCNNVIHVELTLINLHYLWTVKLKVKPSTITGTWQHVSHAVQHQTFSFLYATLNATDLSITEHSLSSTLLTQRKLVWERVKEKVTRTLAHHYTGWCFRAAALNRSFLAVKPCVPNSETGKYSYCKEALNT